MSLFRCAPLALVAAVAIAAATLIRGLPASADDRGRPSLTGQLLVASSEITDPRFFHAVVLVVRHDRTGALGLVINRPVGDRSLASLLEAVGEKDSGAVGSVRIFAGGPVQSERGFVLHDAGYHRPETLDVAAHLAVTSSLQVLHDLGTGQGPSRSLIAFGYAGWFSGQLEAELDQRAWHTAEAETGLVFDEDREKVWDEAMKRRTQGL